MNATTATFWDFIDAVLVINLDHRTERWQQFRAETADIIPAEKLHRISAVFGRELPGFGKKPWFHGRKRDTTWAARGGCVLAHRRALETAKNAGWNRVLILEDDVSVGGNFIASLDTLRTALFESRIQWDVCYLGYTDPEGPFRVLAELTAGHQLAQIFGCNCTHAYIIGAAARDRVLTQLPDENTIWPWLTTNRAIDRWYRKVLGQRFHVVAASPSLINQSAGFSDIVERSTQHHDQGEHLTSLPENPSTAAFPARYFIKTQTVRLSRVWDGIRGIRKRLAGF